MIGLDEAGREFLEDVIVNGRRVLETDLERTAEGRFGIYGDGSIDSEQALKLTAAELVARREVVDIVAHLQQTGESASDAVRHLIREATFTHLNRLVAIRVAEAIGLLPESMAKGKSSRGFRDTLEIAPLLAADDTGDTGLTCASARMSSLRTLPLCSIRAILFWLLRRAPGPSTN